MTHQPNFNNKAIQKRIKHALGFARAVISHEKPQQLSKALLNKHFGHQGNPTSKWLRDHLLVCTNNHYSMDSGKCKEYILNLANWQALKEAITTGITDDVFVQNWAYDAYEDELVNGKFEYTESESGRLFNPLQNIRSNWRRQVFAEEGYEYIYDIESCMPSLLFQQVWRLGYDEYMPKIGGYLANPHRVRHWLADELDIPLDSAKAIINMLWLGAHISTQSDSAMFQLIQDTAKIKWLQEEDNIIAMRAEIKKCWQLIGNHLPRTAIQVNGRERKLPLTGKNKSFAYIRLEREVLDVVWKYLRSKDIPVFLEHDGFVTKEEIDVGDLLDEIRLRTGFILKIKCQRVRYDRKNTKLITIDHKDYDVDLETGEIYGY